eukprot:6212476-Pleurochrysis_carterae.AAC.4
MPRTVSMSELSTEAMASVAMTKRSFSAMDRGQTGAVGVPDMEEACGAVALVAEGVDAECCAGRAIDVGPRGRCAMRGDGDSKV